MNLEDKNSRVVDDDSPFCHIDPGADSVFGANGAEELVLNLVKAFHSHGAKPVGCLSHAENENTAICVRERGDSLKRACR